jgi:uncharacterized membrane protein
MLDRLNVLANAVMFLGSGFFYLMLFSPAVPAFDAAKQFGKQSYWIVRIGLSFFVAGSLLAVLTMPSVTVSQFTRNVGTAILFAWAAWYHANKWGVINKMRRTTGTSPVVK